MNAAQRASIHEAMVRLHAGERAAFDGVLDGLWPVIVAFVTRGLGHSADVEDVAQEVFVKICSRIADFEPERDAVSWAFGIASYEIMTHRRKTYRRREVFEDAPLTLRADDTASQEERLLTEEMNAAMDRALRTLAAEELRALGLDDAPLASTQVSAAAQRKRKQRAVERLRQAWRLIYGEA